MDETYNKTGIAQPKNKNPFNSINIKVPDLISNATAKNNNYTKLSEIDDSDYEIDTRNNISNYKSEASNNYNKPSNSVSIQMQHEVKLSLCTTVLEFLIILRSSRLHDLKNDLKN